MKTSLFDMLKNLQTFFFCNTNWFNSMCYFLSNSMFFFSVCHSPLPPGASDIITQMEDIICKDVFSDDVHGTSEVVKSIDEENMNTNSPSHPACVPRIDQFMPVDQKVSPHLLQLQSDNQQYVESFSNWSSVSSPPYLISELSPVSQSTPSAFDNNERTPMPSPAKSHCTTCNDVFCPTHDCADYSNCPSINTAPSSCQPSPDPAIRNRGKKRLRNYDNWEEVKRKRLRNEGKAYSSKKGKNVPAKTIGKPCTCRYKCYSKLSLEDRINAFNKFWELGNREKQWLHVAHYTTKENKKRGLQRNLKHNRQFTYKYFLPKDSSRVEVCKMMFLNTYSISERLVRTAWEKYDGSTILEKDMRGKHKNHNKVVDDDMIMSVCAHVNSFAPVESHYNRAASKRLYLEGSLSIARMFNLYGEWPELGNYTNTASSLRQYRDIINTHFNLSFHVPKKDTCDQCHSFKHTINPSEELKQYYANHQKSKTLSRTKKSKDKSDALNSNGRIVSATFDFQKVLSCPHGQMSILYYKRKLSCYNFTIYDMAKKQGYCYMWDESIAKRGANEVASCVYDFIKKFVLKGVKEFRFWSDNCAGQNRNRIVFYMYAHAAKEFGVTITHSFLEKGHTQNEGDSVHSVIERAAEHITIYTPDEWKLLVRWAKVAGDSYEVIDVNQSLVFNFKDQLKNKNWVKNIANNKVTWTGIKEVCVEESQSNKIRYKYAFCDDYMTLVLRKETRNCKNPILYKAYMDPIPISNDKFKDLISLCNSFVIPNKYHDFFKNLTHGRNVSDNNEESE